MKQSSPKTRVNKNSQLKSIYSHNISYDGIAKSIDFESIILRQNVYASKLPSHFIREIAKTKNKSTKRGTNTISQRDVLIEQSLRPYMKPSSPIKPNNKSITRRHLEEKDEKIGMTLRK